MCRCSSRRWLLFNLVSLRIRIGAVSFDTISVDTVDDLVELADRVIPFRLGSAAVYTYAEGGLLLHHGVLLQGKLFLTS